MSVASMMLFTWAVSVFSTTPGWIVARSHSQESFETTHWTRSGETPSSSRKRIASIPVLPAPMTT